MNVAAWQDANQIEARLIRAGMRDSCADRIIPNFLAAASAMTELGINKHAPAIACWVPGRIEVLGKHTDYCGGDSVLATAERGFCMIAVPRDDDVVSIVDAVGGKSSAFTIHEGLSPTIGDWSNYPQTVARRIARNFPSARRGATIAMASNLPQSAGMSSSSALVVGTFLLLASINQLDRDDRYKQVVHGPDDLAGYLSTVENGLSFGALTGDRGVGTFGGSEDHTAILCGISGQLVQYSFCPIRRIRSIGLADQYVFAIASSGVMAEKTGAALEKYNRLSEMARKIGELWQRATSRTEQTLAAICEAGPHAAEELQSILQRARSEVFSSGDLLDRFKHFVTERRLIRSIPDAIHHSTLDQFADTVYQSHNAAVTLLKNQTAETIRLVELARHLGARGATAFGAGFGGSVWALVERDGAELFLNEWRSRYHGEFPCSANSSDFFLTRPAPSAMLWKECARLIGSTND